MLFGNSKKKEKKNNVTKIQKFAEMIQKKSFGKKIIFSNKCI